MIRWAFISLILIFSTPVVAWEYDDTVDEMRNIEIKTARVASNNSISDRFGASLSAWIVLRDWPGEGRSAMVRVPSGSFDCPRRGCVVSVKFDEGSIIEYPAVRADSGNYDWIFITNRQDFEKKLKSASDLILEVPLRRKGRAQYKFSVGGLEWPQ